MLVSFKIHTGQFLKVFLRTGKRRRLSTMEAKNIKQRQRRWNKSFSLLDLSISVSKANELFHFFANDEQQVGSKATLNQRRELWKPNLRFAAPKLFSPLQFLALEGEMSAFQEQAWQLEYITAPQALSRLILFFIPFGDQNFAEIYGKL